jgi:cellulase/cellobiase CelA1
MTLLAVAVLLYAGPASGCALTLGNTELICDSLTIQRGRDDQTEFTANSGRKALRLVARCPTKTVCEVVQVARDGAAAKAEGVCRLTLDGNEINELDCRSYSAFGELEMRMWPSR